MTKFEFRLYLVGSAMLFAGITFGANLWFGIAALGAWLTLPCLFNHASGESKK